MPSGDFKTTILVTGANGQLGNELQVVSKNYPSFNFLFTTRKDLPVDDAEALETFFEVNRIDYCINAAAYTAVDKAETEKENAFLVNAKAVGSLAEICKFHKVKLLHVSTDYVYDGSDKKPLLETADTGPVSVYGETKLKGEQLALENNADVLIIRTSWVYSSFGNNFVKTMLHLFKEKPEISVVNDQYGSPTYAADLAKVLMLFIEKMNKGENFSGIFNYCNEGITTWYAFAEEIKMLVHSNCVIHPIPVSSYKTPAQRPFYSVLNNLKIKEKLQIKIPAWQNSLQKCINLLTKV